MRLLYPISLHWISILLLAIAAPAYSAGERLSAAQGIHGQFVLVDPVEHLVVVKLSSWKRPWEDDKEAETYAFFGAVADAVSASPR